VLQQWRKLPKISTEVRSKSDVVVEPSLKNYEGNGNSPLYKSDPKNSLSSLIGVLDAGNKDENQGDLSIQ
jgi:hypothetical protein